MNINCQPPLQFVYFSTDTHIPWISHNTLRDRLFKNGVAIRKKVYYGAQSIIDTLKLLSIDAGNYTIKSAVDANIQRRYNAGYKAKPSSMKRRKVIRGEKRKK